MGLYSKKILKLLEKNMRDSKDIMGYSEEYIRRYMEQFYY